MDKQIFSFDSLVGESAVCVSDSDEVIVLPVSELSGLCVGDLFSARVEEGMLTDITPESEERDRRRADSRARLHALANKTKNKS